MSEAVETIVVGGGQSGLAMSYWLRQAGQEHLVLERSGVVADRWLSQRWDSLCLLTPNWTVSLPGYEYDGPDPDGFMGRDAMHQILVDYAERNAAPVRTRVSVTEVRPSDDGDRYVLQTNVGPFTARNVVIATGPFGIAARPGASEALAADIVQVHSSEYRNPQQLPPGAVLVVGSGASGFQIAEDLLGDGRHVYFSLGRHEGRPRRYRGKDIAYWMSLTGAWDRKLEDNPEAFFAPRSALTGAGGGHDLSVRKLAQDGATLLGRLRGSDGDVITVAPDLAETVREGDQRLQRSLDSVDRFIVANGIDAPPDEPATWPDPTDLADPILQLDLRAAGVTSVVWATGFRYAFDWIRLPVLDPAGNPRHLRGVTEFPGLYFLGLRWLYKFKSSFIHGVDEDAEYLARLIAARQDGRSTAPWRHPARTERAASARWGEA